MLREFTLKTERNNWTDVTSRARETLRESGIANGLCVVYCPHTTAGITINENADPDVVRDLIFALEKTSPTNSAARNPAMAGKLMRTSMRQYTRKGK